MNLPIFTILLSISLSPAEIGRIEAERDIARNHLEFRHDGLPVRWWREYDQLLEDRLGIESNRVAGCVVTDEAAAITDAYNRAMRREIEQRFGPKILDRLADEAKKEHARGQRGRG